MNRAVFIDKDGTLIRNVHFSVDPELIVLEDFVIESLRELRRRGYLLIVVSNQPGVQLKLFTVTELMKAFEHIDQLLQDVGPMDAYYFCPHAGAVELCACRKPMPGMLLSAAKEFQINLDESWMIGDILNDVEAGNRAGCRTVLLDNGNETEWELNEFRRPDFVGRNWKEAMEFILAGKLSNSVERV